MQAEKQKLIATSAFWYGCEHFGIKRFSLSFWALVDGSLLALEFWQAVH
jgi:hypothetical protein